MEIHEKEKKVKEEIPIPSIHKKFEKSNYVSTE